MEKGGEITSTEFWRFAQLAAKHQFEYLVIGGLALNFHKILRNTIDSDLWIKPTKENFSKLKTILIEMGHEEADVEFIDTLTITETCSFCIDGPIDLLTQVHRSFVFDECIERAFFYQIDNIKIPIIGLNDLRDLKIRAKRPQDLRDVILIDEFIEKKSEE
jgi:predicted nucleotidyltransferase